MLRFLKNQGKIYRWARFDKAGYLSRCVLNAEGQAEILIMLDGPQAAFSPFGAPGKEAFSPEVAAYLDQAIYHIPLKHQLVLRFCVSGAAPGQTEQIEKVFRQHYGLILEDKKQDLQLNLLTILGLFLVGVLLLLFSYYLSRTGQGQLFVDIINIAGTFSLWEMVDLWLLDRKVKRIETYNAAQTYAARLVFDPEMSEK